MWGKLVRTGESNGIPMEVPVPSELSPNLIFQDSYYSSSGDMLFIRRVRVTFRLSLLQLLVSVRWSGFGLSQELWTILLIAAGAWIVLWLIKIEQSFSRAFGSLGFLRDHPQAPVRLPNDYVCCRCRPWSRSWDVCLSFDHSAKSRRMNWSGYASAAKCCAFAPREAHLWPTLCLSKTEVTLGHLFKIYFHLHDPPDIGLSVVGLYFV